MKVHQLLESSLADIREKIVKLKGSIASTLKVVRYRVHITRTVSGGDGMSYVMKVDVPSDEDSGFYGRMVRRLLSRELGKLFDRFEVEDPDISKFTGPSGVKIDTLYLRFHVPDTNGNMP